MKSKILYIAIGVAVGVSAMWAIGKFGKEKTDENK